MPEIVRRRSNGEGKAFESQSRHWGMLDTDKAPYPESLDIQADPDSVVRFLKGLLPENLQRAQCVYQFSSSQSVPHNINEPPAKVASAHLWFWCERPVSDQEWKDYLKSQNTKVDLSVFSAVQPHYTANPVFEGMKSLLAMQIMTCVALGKPFLGFVTKRMKVLAVFCEDTEDELQRRQKRINDHYGCEFSDRETKQFKSKEFCVIMEE